MGVCVYTSTMLGALTPTCNACGVKLCWDISEEEYEAAKPFWDEWKCQDCNGGKAMSLKEWQLENGMENMVLKRKKVGRVQDHGSEVTDTDRGRL